MRPEGDPGSAAVPAAVWGTLRPARSVSALSGSPVEHQIYDHGVGLELFWSESDFVAVTVRMMVVKGVSRCHPTERNPTARNNELARRIVLTRPR
jgi:hypothetical protein